MKFVEKSYKLNDAWGRAKIVSFLRAKGLTVKDKEKEDYGVDIEAIDKYGNTTYFEVEVKTNYPFTCEKDYPFKTVSFLARKKKWAAKGFWYIIICRETEHFLICHSDKIFRYEYREKLFINTSDRSGMDYFYRVPKNKCKFFKL